MLTSNLNLSRIPKGLFCFVIGFLHLFLEFGLIRTIGSVRTDISPISIVFTALLSFSLAGIIAPRINPNKYLRIVMALAICSLAFCVAIHLSLLKLAPAFLILFLCGGLFTILSLFFLKSVHTNFRSGYALNLIGSALGVTVSSLMFLWLSPTYVVVLGLFLLGIFSLCLIGARGLLLIPLLGGIFLFFPQHFSRDYPVKPLATDYADLLEKSPPDHRYWNEFGLTEIFRTSRGLEIFFNGGLGRSIFTSDNFPVAQPSLEPVYKTFQPDRVLIVGGIGGGEVALAKKYGAKNISMIELNYDAFEYLKVISTPFKQRFDGVKIYPGSVREIMPRLNTKFDLIQLFSVFIPVRDELYFYPSYTTTTEALKNYIGALGPNGVLHISFNLYIPLVLSLQEASRAYGIEGNFLEHILIFDRPTLDDFHPHVFFKTTAWTQQEKDKLYAGFREFTAPPYIAVDLEGKESLYQYFLGRNFSDNHFHLKNATDRDPFIYNSPKIAQSKPRHSPMATGTMKNILDRFFSDRWIFLLGIGMMVMSVITILIFLRKTDKISQTRSGIGMVFLYASTSIMINEVLLQRSQFQFPSPTLSSLLGVGFVLLVQGFGAITKIKYNWITVIGATLCYLLFSEWAALQMGFPFALKILTYILPVGFLFLCGSFLPKIKVVSSLTETQVWLSYACGLIFGFNLVSILKFTGYSTILPSVTAILMLLILRTFTRPRMTS